MNDYVILGRTVGLGEWSGSSKTDWVCTEPKGRISRITTAFQRSTVVDPVTGHVVQGPSTTKFDTFVLLSPPSDGDAYSKWCEQATQASWDRGAMGCVLHFLYPFVGGPKSQADLRRADVSVIARELFRTIAGPYAGTLLLAPTAATPELQRDMEPALSQFTLSVMAALQSEFEQAFRTVYAKWQGLPEEGRGPAPEPGVAPPIGVIGSTGARLHSAYDQSDRLMPRGYDPIAARKWFAAIDPMGLGAGISADGL